MTSSCHEYEDLLDRDGTVSAAERETWRKHLEQCADCTVQAEADARLRKALTDPPAIPFPSGLVAHLPAHRRVNRPRRRNPIEAWLVLETYGLLAAAASVWILSHIDWPSRLSPGAAGLVLILLCMASPLALVGRVGQQRPARFR